MIQVTMCHIINHSVQTHFLTTDHAVILRIKYSEIIEKTNWNKPIPAWQEITGEQ